MLRESGATETSTGRVTGCGQIAVLFSPVIYRYQKIRVFGAKKKLYQQYLINNILYLHIEKSDTKIIC